MTQVGLSVMIPTHAYSFNLYDTGNFANPFVPLDTGPSAQLTPFYPVFLAMLMKIFGTKSIGLYAMELSAALMLSLQLALIQSLAESSEWARSPVS